MKGFLFDENVPNRLTFTPDLPVIHSSDLGSSLIDRMNLEIREYLWFHPTELPDKVA